MAKSATGIERGKGRKRVKTQASDVPRQSFVPDKLTRQTLNEQVYSQLKEAIISGQLLPGRILTIRDLARSFGVSMMPVREALGRLIAEQVLVMQPNRSVAVPVLTSARFREITGVRTLLERAAAVEGSRKISAAQIETIAALNRQMEHSGPRDHRTYLDLNRQFHFLLYRASGQDYLVSLIETLWMQIGPLLNLLLDNPDVVNHDPKEHHDEIVSALQKQRHEAVGDAVVADLTDAARFIEDVIERGVPEQVEK